jgi:hypothetical protein
MYPEAGALEYTRTDLARAAVAEAIAAGVRAGLLAAAVELDGCNLALDPADMADEIRAIAADPAQVAAIAASVKGSANG